MNKTYIVVIIAVLAVLAICLCALIAVTPDPVKPPPPDPHTPNELAAVLEIERNTSVQREILMALRTYTNGVDENDINLIAQTPNTNLRYFVLDKNAKGHLLLVPFEINGTITISRVKYDSEDTEDYYVDKSEVIFKDKVTPNYALLLKYDRPDTYEYEIKLTQGEQTSTYWILNKASGGGRIEATQFIKEDRKGETETIIIEKPVYITNEDSENVEPETDNEENEENNE